MRLRFIFVWSLATTAACSSSDFSLSEGADAATDTATGSTDGVANEDTRTVEPHVDGGACDDVNLATVTVYVDAAAAPGGTGASGCPFRTLAEAANAPLSIGTARVVSVHAGTYVETAPLKVRPGETYRADGSGLVKVIGNGTTSCATSDSCTFQLDTSSTLDGITIEGGSAANGIVVAAMSGLAPVIKNTTVRAAPKDGIVVLGVGATLGPNTHADANAWSGMMIRNGRVVVTGVGNTFDGNKGGTYIGSTYVAGSGIHVRGGAGLFLDGGTTTNNNANGVFFDAGGASGTQTISQLTATGNRAIGVHIAKGWQVVVRKSYLTKNTGYGLLVSYDTTTTVDLGTVASPGGNTFGTPSARNGKAGIFLCRSPLTGAQTAEGNTWAACPPTQTAVGSCDTFPASYTDVAYAPESSMSTYLNPIAIPAACTAS